jgi:hypothetical protein
MSSAILNGSEDSRQPDEQTRRNDVPLISFKSFHCAFGEAHRTFSILVGHRTRHDSGHVYVVEA